jgi:hypothetical protein
MEAKMAISVMRSLLGNKMVSTRVIALVVQFTMARETAAQLPTGQPIPLMDLQREIALALSSCPSTLAEKAGVYVLEASGYVNVHESQNGFTAIVQHSLPGVQEAQCMDAESARTILLRILKVAELRAQVKSPDEIRRLTNADIGSQGQGVSPVFVAAQGTPSALIIVPLPTATVIGPAHHHQ